MSAFRVMTVLLFTWLRTGGAVGDIAVSYVGGNDQAKIIRAFNKWMDDNGGKSWSKVEVSYIEGFRLGLLAREDIAEGEVYLNVPWHMLIHSESIRASQFGKEFAKLQKDNNLDVFHELMLFFLHELHNPESFWKPFLDILPAHHNTPIHWTDAELAELKGTRIPAAVKKYVQEARRNYNKDKNIIDANPELFDPAISKALTFERYLWASSTMDSRTIWIDGRFRSFLPILDMANNKDHPTKAHRTSRDMKKDSTATVSIWKVAKGEQVFENYNTANFDNLLYHGFTLQKNLHDNSEVEMPVPPKVYHRTLGRIRARPKYSINGDQGVPVPMLAHARVVSLAPADLSRHSKTSFYKRVNLANEKRALKLVENTLKKSLKGLSGTGTIASDQELLQRSDLTQNLRTAVVYRLQQKQHVQSCLDKIVALLSKKKNRRKRKSRKKTEL